VSAQFTDEVVGQVKSSDATFAALQQHFDSELILEILITVGMYMTAARIMENLEIDIEADGGPSMDVVRERAASVIAPSKD
jgi:alkylhydroperoxidase family enzyme